ncbi:alanine racemase [Bacteriovoracaceae bacterium]|nr:alanine racemase [Bacteriovoracaceae bacterium]
MIAFRKQSDKLKNLFKQLLQSKNLTSTLNELEAPSAFLIKSHLDYNIHLIREKVEGKKIRIASKSVRNISVIKYVTKRLGDTCSGVMAYHPREALFLLQNGIRDVLLGYPCYHPEDCESLIRDYNEKVTFMVDTLEHVELLDSIGVAYGKKVRICLDIDMSIDIGNFRFGVFRSSLMNIDSFTDLLEKILSFNSVRIVGIMGYEAQVAGIPDLLYNGAKNLIISLLKKRSMRKIISFRKKVCEILQHKGVDLEFFNAGGTGSIDSSKKEEWVTEITVGSGFYDSYLFDFYKNLPVKPSLFFNLLIVRKPRHDIATLHGGGYVASGAIGLEKVPAPIDEKVGLLSNELAGEVQTPIKLLSDKHSYKIGDRVIFRHAKAGELCEHFNHVYLLDQEYKPLHKWKTYRGEGQIFV